MDAKKIDTRELKRLRSFGYRDSDLEPMDEQQIADILRNRRHRPGSARAAAKIAAEIGMPGLPAAATDEGIEARIAGKPTGSAFVIKSDYERDLEARASLRQAGAQAPSPQDEIAQPFVEANPDRSFRWMTRQHCEKRGDRGYQPTINPKTGKKVTHLNDGRWLGNIPKDVREARLASYREQSKQQQAAARESAVEAGRRAEVESGGGIRMLPPEEMTRLIEGQGRFRK